MSTLVYFLAALSLLFANKIQVVAGGCWRDSNCSYGRSGSSFNGTWDKYNYSPKSRTVSPVTIYSSTFDKISTFPPPNPVNICGNGSELIFDFGKEVAGIVTVHYTATGSGTMGLAFSEARNWTGQYSDSSNSFNTVDGAIYADISSSSGTYTMPDDKLRGGFRYLTLFTTTSSSICISISDITLEISYAPTWSNLRAYGGYFYSSDDLLNRIWYAGAYTLQTNSIAAKTGRQFPVQRAGWENNADLHPGAIDPTLYVDGAKRDRIVWAGDLSIAVPSILAGTGDWNGVRYTIDVLYNAQASNGGLPFAGPAAFFYSSDTYHIATMLGTYEYLLWTNDGPWMNYVYPKYKAAMAFIIGKMDDSGMLDVTGTNDWGLVSKAATSDTEANMLLFRALVTRAEIATWAGDSGSSSNWNSIAASLKTTMNNKLWDAAAGAYKESDTNPNLHPEDGNSMALLFGVPTSNSMAQTISKQLTSNWGPLGAICPELQGNHVPFIQSFEIKGHFAVSQATRALDLIRRSWGWYLNNPYGTESTCVEGYRSDGTFGYRADTGYEGDYSFTSHSHGWSTGPVAALSTYIVGLSLTAPGGSKWNLAPQFGDLTSAQGGLTTPLGPFSAGWTLMGKACTLWYNAPNGTTGTIVTPGGNSKTMTVTGDGNKHEVNFSL